MAQTRVGEARFSLLLQGDDMPMEQIEQALQLKATKVLHKGEMINRIPLVEAATDEWMHTITLGDPQVTDAGLNELLAHVASRMDVVKNLQEKYSMELRLYVQSDYAQMAYSFMPETLQKLAALGLPLSVSSLSWGEFSI